MMQRALADFRHEIKQLTDFLEAAIAEEHLYPLLNKAIQDAKDVASRDPINQFMAATTSKKRYTYAVGIISLYGAVESFVRSLVEQYLNVISRLSGDVSKLPDKISENHTHLSISYLMNVREKKINNDDTVELVVARLAKCLMNDHDFELNANAFLMRGQNVNRERIRQIASGLGINIPSKRLIKTNAAVRYFSERDPSVLETSSDEVAQSQFSAVDLVTEARNLIAHGVAELCQIENPHVLLAYAAEIVAYCEAVSSVFEQELILHAIECGLAFQMTAPIQTFGDNIVCFDVHLGRIRVGDILALSLDDDTERLRFSPIESLQIDGINQVEIVGQDNLKAGVKVTFRVAQRPSYYVLDDSARKIIFPD
jgi:hypothetical protein